MNPLKLMNPLIILACGIMATVVVSGCLPPLVKIGLQYTPQMNVTPVAGAEQVSLNVKVMDVRPHHWLRSETVYNSYIFSESQAYFEASNDVEIVRQALEEELAHRGFQLGGKLQVLAGLSAFETAGHGSIALSVQVKKPDGVILYSELVTGRSHKRATDKKMAEAALRDCMAKLFSDPAFLNALVKTSAH